MTTAYFKNGNSIVATVSTSLLFVLVSWVLFIDFFINYTISLDDILALILLTFAIRLVLTQSVKGQYVVLGILIVSLINILQFNIIIRKESYTTTHNSATVGALSFNAFAFLLIIFYCFVNWRGLKAGVKVLLRGSESEQSEKREKLLVFYYDKFKGFTEDELRTAFGMFKDYPLEARQALQQIKNERNIL